MHALIAPMLIVVAAGAAPLGPGDHERALQVGELKRSYRIHVPPKFDPKKPTPVVLSFHGAWTNAAIHAGFTGLHRKADEAGFVEVEPNGTGTGPMLFWNAGLFRRSGVEPVDDVAFVAAILDDLGSVMQVDRRRVFATGMSNGGMMCYRLAAELADRIAAIAPVGGTMAIDSAKPCRAVPVIHFHGTEDTFVPIDGPVKGTPRFVTFKSLDETIKTWARIDGCPEKPTEFEFPDKAGDGTVVTRFIYGPGRQGSEVVLYRIQGGGHTWPGMQPMVKLLGKSTTNISANDLIWEFFQKHPMP